MIAVTDWIKTDVDAHKHEDEYFVDCQEKYVSEESEDEDEAGTEASFGAVGDTDGSEPEEMAPIARRIEDATGIADYYDTTTSTVAAADPCTHDEVDRPVLHNMFASVDIACTLAENQKVCLV